MISSVGKSLLRQVYLHQTGNLFKPLRRLFMTLLAPPPSLTAYWQDAFSLKRHLQEFLQLESEDLEHKLNAGLQALAEMGHRDFDWEQATEFYRDQVGEAYLFDLGIWHLTSQEYIGDTLRLVADYAKGRVLDFGGGIGTHTIGAALCQQVQQVVYCDINPTNRAFVEYRAAQLGLESKIICCAEVSADEIFDTIICFDVVEHLPAPSQQLLQFHKMQSETAILILNWYFSKGFNQEFPFHLDDPRLVEHFFTTLQGNFLEVFHPYHVTTRCYRKSATRSD